MDFLTLADIFHDVIHPNFNNLNLNPIKFLFQNLNHDYRKRGGDLYDNDYRFGKRNTVVLDENEENTVERYLSKVP